VNRATPNKFRAVASFAVVSMCVACTSLTDLGSTMSLAPKVILIIGDGMDDQQITIGRNYLVGHNGRLVVDDLPYRGSIQVQTLAEDDPSVPVYVGDSASGATAIATGIATSEGRIGTTANSDLDVANLMELADAAGFGTGIVTTSSVTDASPASFMAHIEYRYCDTPDAMERENIRMPQDSTSCGQDRVVNGGLGSVVEQVATSKMDIVLGGGSDKFTVTVDGDPSTTVREQAKSNGYTVIQHLADLDRLPAENRVLGLFSSGHFPVRLRGVNGAKAEYIDRVGDKVVWPEPFACEANPEFVGVPTLASMTKAAIGRLNSDAGFMLMVEAASIDKEAHYWRPCGSIGEMEQLNEAVQVALDYAKSHPETLIIVTSDHGQSAHIIPEVSNLALQGFASRGRFARLLTPEGGIMGINYATNDSPHWEDHSGVQVPLYASGPGVEDLPRFLKQSDIFHIAATHLGLGVGQQYSDSRK